MRRNSCISVRFPARRTACPVISVCFRGQCTLADLSRRIILDSPFRDEKSVLIKKKFMYDSHARSILTPTAQIFAYYV